jgi:hypothetical protein
MNYISEGSVIVVLLSACCAFPSEDNLSLNAGGLG